MKPINNTECFEYVNVFLSQHWDPSCIIDYRSKLTTSTPEIIFLQPNFRGKLPAKARQS
jgi:hypothetical protein